MKLRSLRMIDHFLAAHRTGTFHAAAKQLGVSQTAITKSIQELESTLNCRLFTRSVQGVELTAFGELLRRRAIQIELQNDFLEREIVELSSGRSGNLRIGAGTVWASVLLPPVLARIQAANPETRFVVLRSVGQRMRELLERGEIDLGLGLGLEPLLPGEDSAYAFEHMMRVQTTFFVRRDHPLTRLARISAADMARFAFAMYRLDDFVFQQLGARFLADGVTLAAPGYLADSISSVMSFVAHSDHITCLPAPIRVTASAHGLVEIKAGAAPSFPSGAIYMQAATSYPLLETVLRELRRQARETA